MKIVCAALVLAASACAHAPSPELAADASTPGTSGSVVAPGRASLTVPTGSDGPALSIRRIETRLGAADAQDFVIEFDGPVPDDRVAYVDESSPAEATYVQYRTQEWTPDKPTPLWTCGDAHAGFSPPATVGQVDVLMPASWFERPPEADRIIWEQLPEGQALKTPLCGPHDGYVQLAIWAPSSHDPDDIRVHFDDHTRLVVEIRPSHG